MADVLLLGNTAVVEVIKTEEIDDNGTVTSVTEERVKRPKLGNQITTVEFVPGMKLSEKLAAVESLWPKHSDDLPEWVESDDSALAGVVADQFTTDDHECRVGRPSGWKEGK